MKKNNTAEKTVLNAEQLTKAIKEGTEKSLRDMMNEAISKMVKESADEEDSEDDSFDVEDVDTEETPMNDVSSDGADTEGEDTDAEGEDTDTEGEEGSDEDDTDDEWSDMEEYKVGDNDYDFTGVDDEEVLKVYNKLGDDDQIFVKKEDDGTYSVKDDETGAEFVIELNPDALDADSDSDDSFDTDGEDNLGGDDLDVDVDVDDEDGDEDAEFEFDFGNEDSDGDDSIELDINDDDDSDEELNEENLGYTDSYQKDVFSKKFNMKEPANSKATYSMDGGAPQGSEKPWAGKGDSDPFEKKVNESDDVVDTNLDANDANIEEAGVARRKGAQTTSGNLTNSAHADYMQKGSHNVHKDGQSGETINETIKKVVNKAKEIQAENKQYKSYLDRIKKSVCEQATLNANLIRLVDILVNETTTKDEKKSICERFNAVKTVAEGKELYARIKTELNETKKSSAPIVEKQFTASSTNALNENVIYRESNPALNLMDRMDNLFKKQ